MPVVLEIKSGPSAGKRVVLSPGQVLQVGRYDKANVVVANDAMMSNVHFDVACEGDACRVRDLNSRFGTTLNGQKVTEALARHGDRIVAGQTTFVVRALADEVPAPVAAPAPVAPPRPVPPAPAPPPRTTDLRPSRLVDALRRRPEPLYGLLDAARDPKVLELLRASKEQYQSLYEGVQGEVLAAYAPYLVSLPPECGLLNDLLAQGWGKSWGVFLTCEKPFAEVRKHFRHFLLVDVEGGERMYFRFYDPRVLRVFLPTCTPTEAKEFFGPVRTFLVESDKGDAVAQFVPAPDGAVPAPALVSVAGV
jgi:pSer/pThr/pTyr-binding forkhead associated (FHA) protein